MKHYLPVMFTAFSVSLLVSMVTHSVLNRDGLTVVSFDVKGTLDAYHQELLKADLDLETQTQRLTRFATIMHEEVLNYDATHHSITVVSAAVVGDAVDVTPHIQKAIIRRYQEEQ